MSYNQVRFTSTLTPRMINFSDPQDPVPLDGSHVWLRRTLEVLPGANSPFQALSGGCSGKRSGHGFSILYSKCRWTPRAIPGPLGPTPGGGASFSILSRRFRQLAAGSAPTGANIALSLMCLPQSTLTQATRLFGVINRETLCFQSRQSSASSPCMLEDGIPHTYRGLGTVASMAREPARVA